MSVINRMLSDLDARRAPAPAATGTATAGSIEAVSAGVPRRLGLTVLVGAALVSAAAFGQWPALLGTPSSAPQPVAMSAEPATSAITNPAPDSALVAFDEPARLPPESAGEARWDAPLPADRRIKHARIARHAIPVEAAATAPPPVATDTAVAMLAPSAAITEAAPAGPASVEKRVIPPSASQRAAFAYQQALDNAASGHSNPAIAHALDALKSQPDHLAARELAAVLMIESKRLGDAAALMRDGLERQPQQPRLTMLLARIDAETGASQTALDRLTGAPALDAEGHGLRAALLTRAERFREAAAAYEEAVRLQPDNASWWFGLGVALEANGQAPLARQALQRARAIGSLRGDALAYVEQKLASRE